MLELTKIKIKICHNCKCGIKTGSDEYYTVQKKDGNEYIFCDECFNKLYGKLEIVEAH